MKEDEIKNKIKELTDLINQWNYEYYALDNPSVEDYVYDSKLRELISLEQQYPQYKLKDSPTLRVGGVILDKFEKIKHLRPMLSLDNIFDYNGVEKFCEDIQKNINEKINYVVEPKIDGLSISIIYENAKLKYACTRGDGEYGEDVTSNILTINEIPQYINNKYKNQIIEVRGEVYMSIDSLNQLNNESNKKFANTRNAAAGALRNLNSSITKSRNLQAFFYYVFTNNDNENNLSTQFDVINWLKENKFPTAPIIKKCENDKQIWDHIEYINSIRKDLKYEIDGVVIKLNQRQYYEEIGYTSKFPKWAIAYKFPAQIVSTKLIDIKTDVGRTGKINFIAQLEPISLNGSTISAATLHNLDFINQKDIHINDYVKIYKAGDVIPYVDCVDLTKRNKDQIINYHFNFLCPSCHQKVITFDDNIDYYCINEQCIEKQIKTIEYFVSKDIMDIEGLSYSIIKKLYNKKYINDQWDLYNLINLKQEIINDNLQIKEKLFNKLWISIEKSKNNSLERLIASFNIKNVGITIATVLAKKFNTLDNFLNADYNELINIGIVGEKIANNIIDFINNESTKIIVQKIKTNNINTIYNEQLELDNYDQYKQISELEHNQQYKNKNVVITGTFSIGRDEIKKILESLYNCKIQSSVNKKTDFVLAGENCGTKLDKAKELNILIINQEFWKS